MRSIARIIQPSNLTIASASQFQSEIRSVLESGVDTILVDLGNVTSVTSASFIELVKGLKLVQGSSCTLSICSANQQLNMLFELTGLDQIFNLVQDVHQVHHSTSSVAKVTHLETAKAA